MERAQFHPRLACRVTENGDEIVLERGTDVYALGPNRSTLTEMRAFLDRLDGRRNLDELEAELDADERSRFSAMIEQLDECLLLDDSALPHDAESGAAFLPVIVGLFEEQRAKSFRTNAAWRTLAGDDADTRQGAAIRALSRESYHLWFQGPPTSLPRVYFTSRAVRTLLNQFLVSLPNEQDSFWRLFRTMDISLQEVERGVAAPATSALSGALSYWSRTDPLVYFIALELMQSTLPSRGDHHALYRSHGFTVPRPPRATGTAAEGPRLPFISTVFREIAHVDASERARLVGQVGLLFEMYDVFLTAVGQAESPTPTIVRDFTSL